MNVNYIKRLLGAGENQLQLHDSFKWRNTFLSEQHLRVVNEIERAAFRHFVWRIPQSI